MQRLTEAERNQAFGMLRGGMVKKAVANFCWSSLATIGRLLQQFTDAGTVHDRSCPGRERVTTPAVDLYIVLQHLRDWFKPTAKTADEIIGVHRQPLSRWTVMQCLKKAGLKCRRPYVGPRLTYLRCSRRISWTQLHQRWSPNYFYG